jgi:hypothetical protein
VATDAACSRLRGTRKSKPQFGLDGPGHGAAFSAAIREPKMKDEEMRIKPNDRATWRRWFAWYPVLIDNVIVWFEIIERKRDPDIFDWVYSYRVIDRSNWREYLVARWVPGRGRLREDQRL